MRMVTSIAMLALLAGCGVSPRAAVVPGAGFDALKATTTTPATYYKGIGDKSGKALARALKALVSKHKSYDYDPARDLMFTKIDDPQGTHVIRDVYLQREFRGVRDTKTATQRGLNTEHTWCQSMGAADGPLRSDLHHLFPADAGTNSARGNKPFGDVHGLKEKMPEFLGDGLQSATGNDVAGAEVFEPRNDHKGDVARALLYVYVTYAVDAPAKSIMKLDNFKQEQAVLQRWNTLDPVSAKEKARNEAIYKLQGNRNPFIDHPEWVARLGKLI